MKEINQPVTPQTYRGNFFSGIYSCPELRQNTSRRNAMQSHSLPSRVGSGLHWPDGRITDLQGNALQAVALAQVTTPAFTKAKPVAVSRPKSPLKNMRSSKEIQYFPKGSRASQSKLTEDAVRSARKARAEGARYPELARLHGVSETTMIMAVKRETWKHVL